MKKQPLSFVFLLFFITQTKAQTSVYYPFPDSSAIWNETVRWYDGHCDGNEFYTISINGDTVIGSNLYQKLSETGYSYSSICDTTIYFTNIYMAAIRQNASLKKVFIVPEADTTEMLLYNFNLSLGDTLPATYKGAGNYNYVISVDSVLIGNKYRKSFGISVLDSAFDYMTLIEGIGSTFGLIAPFTPPSEYSYLLNCFIQSGQTLYPDSSSPCSLTIPTGIHELSSEDFISMYPNPATKQLTIHTSRPTGRSFGQASFRNEAITVLVMNMLGQETSPPTCLTPALSPAKGGTDAGEGGATIYIGNLPTGMYFLQIKWESGCVMKKFVKE